jgi:hypothetical protein
MELSSPPNDDIVRLGPRHEKFFGMTGVESVVHQVNDATGARWELQRPLSGGLQSGACEVVGGNCRAVLKWSPRTWWAPRVLNAAKVVAFARQKGYPTPAWLAWGTTQEGYPYVVYEYLEGARRQSSAGPKHGLISTSSNLIFRHGVFQGVVDIEAVGLGAAAQDLMAGLRTAYLWPGETEDGVAAVLEQAALEMFDPNVILICVASQIIEILNFVLRRWPERVEPVARRAVAWIAATRKLIAD